MKCECGQRARVRQTRNRSDGTIYRRYECVCGLSFTGLEGIVPGSVTRGPLPDCQTTGAIEILTGPTPRQRASRLDWSRMMHERKRNAAMV